MFENSHPTDEQLVEYIAGDVPSDLFEEIDRHLDDCEECCERLDRAVDEPSRAAVPLDVRTLSEVPEACRRMMQNAVELVRADAGGESAWDVERTIDANAETIDSDREPMFESARGAAYADGEVFGDYEIIREIARGGMGVVYLARQVKLNREVAIKMILDSRLASEESVRRFRAEAESAARLDHPGIVPVYEVGEFGGQQFFSMGYVNGRSLRQLLDAEGPLESRRAAEIVASIARTVQYAHTRNIVHRDLKPGNVLIDAAGTPKLTDFGLAKDFESGEHLTSDGRVLGTPHYMAPEQAAGRTAEVGPLSDVYSLGAILYHVVSSRPPFSEDSVLRTLNAVVNDEPVSPRKFNPEVDADLVTICLKCLEKDPARRYASAGDVADELERYLGGYPIEARTISVPERISRWLQRNPRVLWGMVATLLVLVSTVFYAAYELERVAFALEKQLEETQTADLDSSSGWMAEAVERELSAKSRQTQIAAGFIRNDEDLRNALREDPTAILKWHVAAIAAEHEARPWPEFPSELRKLQAWVSHDDDWNTKGWGADEPLYGPNLWENAQPEVSHNVLAWWVCGSDGHQLVRDPMVPVVNLKFAHRSYFTGLPSDDKEGSEPTPDWKPGDLPRLSAPFLTQDTNRWVIAISAPVFDVDRSDGKDPELLGVVGMFVEVGELMRTHDEYNESGRIAILLDARHGDAARILEHPYLRDPVARAQLRVPGSDVATTTVSLSDAWSTIAVDPYGTKNLENTERYQGLWRSAPVAVRLPRLYRTDDEDMIEGEGANEPEDRGTLIAIVREPVEVIADPSRRLRANLRSLGLAIIGLFLIPPLVALFLATRRRA